LFFTFILAMLNALRVFLQLKCASKMFMLAALTDGVLGTAGLLNRKERNEGHA